jgi:hypothetical protein
MTWTELKEIINLLQMLVVPVLVYGLYRLDKIEDALIDIRNHLAKLNGRVGTCDALRQAHERDDDRKHDDCGKRVEKVEAKLMGAS